MIIIIRVCYIQGTINSEQADAYGDLDRSVNHLYNSKCVLIFISW